MERTSASNASTVTVERPLPQSAGPDDPPEGVVTSAAPGLRLARSTLEDEEVAWVRQSQAGDPSAFENLVRGTARMLYARLYVDVGDRDRTEDLVQETYLVAWKSIGQLRDVPDASAFRRWLFAIARTVRLDQGRHDRRKKRGWLRLAGSPSASDGDSSDDPLTSVRDPSPGPGKNIEDREDHDRALALLRSLPDEYRLPISMRYLAGADYESICTQLGLTNGSLRGLLGRGMARLRAMLALEES